jgi:hypothetical protein
VKFTSRFCSTSSVTSTEDFSKPGGHGAHRVRAYRQPGQRIISRAGSGNRPGEVGVLLDRGNRGAWHHGLAGIGDHAHNAAEGLTVQRRRCNRRHQAQQNQT